MAVSRRRGERQSPVPTRDDVRQRPRCEKDYRQAVEWFRRAAVQGNAAAEIHYEADNFLWRLHLPATAQVEAADKAVAAAVLKIEPAAGDSAQTLAQIRVQKRAQKQAQRQVQKQTQKPAQKAIQPTAQPAVKFAAQPVAQPSPPPPDSYIEILTKLAALGNVAAERRQHYLRDGRRL